MMGYIHTFALGLLLRSAAANVFTLTVTAPSSVTDTITASSLPLPTPSIDTNIWSPIATIFPASTTSTSTPLATATTPPSVLEKIQSYIHHDLLKRQGGAPIATTGAVAQPVPTQVSPLTTAELYTYKDGSALLFSIVYTQLFSSPLDPWSGPVQGEIGLGSIQGTVGVVKTNAKRSFAVPTQAPELLGLSEQSVEAVKGVRLGESEKENESTSESLRTPALSTSESKSAKLHFVDVKAGSALALILAIAAMIVV